MSDVMMRVTAVDYKTEDDEVLIQLAGRDEHGDRRTLHVEDTVPYFYAPEDEAHLVENEDAVRRVRKGYESYNDVPLCRVDVEVPGNCNERSSEDTITELVSEPWEDDIPFYRRASIDYNLSGHIRVPDEDRCSIDEIETGIEVSSDDIIEPRILIADIEVIPPDGVSFDEMTDGYSGMVSHISAWDSQTDEYIVLHVDPEDRVDNSEVASLLDAHTEAESLSRERARDIIIRSYETEESLLSGFLSLVENRRPDLTSGWNWDDFDWDYLLGRMEKFDNSEVNEHNLSDIGWISGYKTERMVDCLPAFDMMDAYCDKMTRAEWRSTSLDYVSKVELGTGKLPNVSIVQKYEDSPSELLAYNIIDTMLCVALERREGIHEFFYELAELSQVQIYDTMSEMRLVDGYIMSRAGDDEILPSMPDDQDIPDNAGGLVLHPSDGVREWVGVVDLKSLYPSTIITWNISPETIHWYEDETPGEYFESGQRAMTDGGVTAQQPGATHLDTPWLPDADHADGGEFTHDEIDFDVMWTDLTREGLIPRYIKKLFPERAEKKRKRNQYDPDSDLYDTWDRKQSAVKVLMNSFYGVMSMDYWRLAVYGLGDAVTSASRYALWKGKEIAADEGYQAAYGDTDSVMLEMAQPGEGKQAALTRGKDLEETINRRMDECIDRSGLKGEHPHLTGDLHGTDRHCLTYEFEKLYRRFFQAGTKKRYGGDLVWKEGKDVDDIDMTGFESERSDSPEITGDAQPKVVKRILAGQEFEEISEYIQGLIEDFENYEMEMYRVALPSSLGQPLDEYGNTQVARACRFSNDHLGSNWQEGDDPWVYFVRTTPPMTPGTDVIALDWDEDIPDGYELDDDAIFDRALKGPLMPILREMNWRWTEVKKGAKTQSAAEASWSADDYDDEDDDDDNDQWGSW